MWSITLIIVAAVASSFVMLGAGVTLAITIERHRHHKILRAHGIGGTSSPAQCNRTTTGRMSTKHLSIRESLEDPTIGFEGRTVLASGGMPQSNVAEAIEEEAIQADSTDSKHITDLIQRISRRGSYGQRKLRKSMPLYPSMHSPLSAIMEFTDSPKSCPSSVELPTGTTIKPTNAEGHGPQTVPWPLAVVKTRHNHSVDTTDASRDASCPAEQTKTTTERPKLPVRSVSMASTISDPPNDPLPALPKIEILAFDHAMTKRSSVGSIDTINSSVLEQVPSIKPPSQALDEFDFGLDSVLLRLDSPARQTQQGFYDQRTKITSYRASMGATECADIKSLQSSSRGLLELLEISTDRDGRFASGSTVRRHSMFTDCKNVSVLSSCTIVALKHHSDSFKSRIPVRSACINGFRESDWISRPRSIAHCDRIRCTAPQTKGHKRQNCVQISIPLVENKDHRQLKMPQVMEEHESGIKNSSKATILPAKVNNFLWPQPLTLQQTTANPSSPKFDCDVFYCDSHLITEETDHPQECVGNLASSNSSPSHGHLTPILPSPAYSAARLFPRLSKVQGPRNIPHRTKHFKRKSGTPDLRRSVMMLRSIQSDEKLFNETQKSSHYNPGSSRDSINSLSRWSSRARSRSPLSSRSLTPQKNIVCSKSAMSIWEDVPIRDDPPDPELLSLSQSSIFPNNREVKTPVKPGVDQEASKNSVNKSAKPRTHLTNGIVEIVGLGLHLDSVAETPKSLYDREGFLKE